MFENLKKEWDDNPMLVIALGTMATTAAAKLIDALSSIQGRRAYSKQVNLRAKK